MCVCVYKSIYFRGASTNERLTEISVLNAKGTILKKTVSFIFVLVNSFSFYTFWTRIIYIYIYIYMCVCVCVCAYVCVCVCVCVRLN